MKFIIEQDDPLQVLSSTKSIVENLKYIEIHEANFNLITTSIEKKLSIGLDTIEMHFGKLNSLENSVQLIFLEDTVNFCFWAEKNKPKWQVEWPKGKVSSGGWYSLGLCFQRALDEGIPILDSTYLISLTLDQAKSIFKGVDNITIPLLEKRLDVLKEAGKVLEKKYSGKFINALKKANFDAIKIVKLLYEDFPSFRDSITLDGKRIYFLKRAQICAQDFSYLEKQYEKIRIKNINLLTGFADYKIPQMLRKFGVISYNRDLAKKIDNYVLIPAESKEEIEIRATTIWCIELIKQKLGKYTAAEIDNALWLISQDQKNALPYHRTYTIYY